MNCHIHPLINSVAACESCKKGVCVACAVEVDDRIYCRQCASKLLRQARKEREAALEKERKLVKPVTAVASSAWVGPEPNVEYPTSVCYRHPKVASVAICKECGNGICAACGVESEDGMMCRPCAIALIKKSEPAAEEAAPVSTTVPTSPAISIAALGEVAAAQPKPKEEPKSEAKPLADVDKPAQPLSIAALGNIAAAAQVSVKSTTNPVQSLSIAALGAIVAAQAAAKSVVKSEPAQPPVVEQPIPREVDEVTKVVNMAVYEERPPESYEPKIPLLLSVIVPGYGQIYNGHWRKGIMLLIVEMFIWIFVAALLLRYISGSLWLVLAIACVLILFSGYDAYKSALKIKNGQTVVDWFS